MKSIFLKSGFAEEGLSKRLACQLFVDEQWEKSVVSGSFGWIKPDVINPLRGNQTY